MPRRWAMARRRCGARRGAYTNILACPTSALSWRCRGPVEPGIGSVCVGTNGAEAERRGAVASVCEADDGPRPRSPHGKGPLRRRGGWGSGDAARTIRPAHGEGPQVPRVAVANEVARRATAPPTRVVGVAAARPGAGGGMQVGRNVAGTHSRVRGAPDGRMPKIERGGPSRNKVSWRAQHVTCGVAARAAPPSQVARACTTPPLRRPPG